MKSLMAFVLKNATHSIPARTEFATITGSAYARQRRRYRMANADRATSPHMKLSRSTAKTSACLNVKTDQCAITLVIAYVRIT
jgi:hypothetical protein